VWGELARIPYGETRAYSDLARALDRPRAARAVGAANGQNPLSIVVPCHRVLGRDGRLHGYAGGEPAKRWLLEHERV
jgi:methylated-DNA-[protein]-cysteine S-methyltransferase